MNEDCLVNSFKEDSMCLNGGGWYLVSYWLNFYCCCCCDCGHIWDYRWYFKP